MLFIIRCSEQVGEGDLSNFATQRSLLENARDAASTPDLQWVTPPGGHYIYVGSSVGNANTHELTRFCADMARGKWPADAVVVALDASRLGRRGRNEAEAKSRRSLPKSWRSGAEVVEAAGGRRLILLMDCDRFTGQPPLDSTVPGHTGQMLQLLQQHESVSLLHGAKVMGQTRKKREDRAEQKTVPIQRVVPALDLQAWAESADITVRSKDEERAKRQLTDPLDGIKEGARMQMHPGSASQTPEAERRAQLLEAARAVERRRLGRDAGDARVVSLSWGRYWMVSDVLASEYGLRRSAHSIRAADLEWRNKQAAKEADE